MSTFGSSIAEKRRIVIKNPDGTFMHCYKSGDVDSTLQVPNEKPNANQDDLTITDSDLQYIVENYEQFDQGNIIEEFLTILNRNQIIFFLLLTIEFSLSLFLLFVIWKKKDNSIFLVQKLYKELSYKASMILFYTVYGIAFATDLVFYPIGYYALYTKKIKLLGYFANIALVTGVMTIFVVYINILFLLVFIMRLVLYTFAKFICNLLISIIVLPRRIQNSDYNTI